MLTIILHPKGKERTGGRQELTSLRGLTRLEINWKVVELWKFSAETLLAANDVGLIPWVPLTHFSCPPEEILKQCIHRIDQQSPTAEHANLQAVMQVLARLRYNDPHLLAILGGKRVMIESPIIQELLAERTHENIQMVLTERFGQIPGEITKRLQKVVETETLNELIVLATRCASLEAFLSKLPE